MREVINEFGGFKKESKAGRKKQDAKRSKTIKVHSSIQELIKYNSRELDMGEYVEALIMIDRVNKVEWEFYQPKVLKEEDNHFVRILPVYHKKAKHNLQRLQIKEYIEGLVLLDNKDKVDWSVLDKAIDNPIFGKHNQGNPNIYKSADGRKRFSTMMTPELKSRLQAYGNEHGLSIADIIELSTEEFLNNNK